MFNGLEVILVLNVDTFYNISIFPLDTVRFFSNFIIFPIRVKIFLKEFAF